ncbi:MAG: PEP-CTERM sorting domain-containing protein [Planctomycetota bacterium]
MKERAVLKAFPGLLTIVLFICTVPVSATIVSFDMDVIFEGPGVPTNPSPWVNVTIDDGGTAGTVDLTVSAPGLTTQSEKISALYLNLDPALDPTQLAFSAPIKTGNLDDPIISLGVDSFKANGDGFFDILLDFDKDGWKRAFNGGDILQYTISLASLTADSFVFPSAPDGDPGEYTVAVHLLSLGATGDSAWANDSTIDPIPEPATIFILSLGGLALLRKRRV